MFFYGIDSYYLLLVLPAIIIAGIAQARVSSTFAKYNRIANMQGLTAAQVARRILDSNGLTSIVIEHVKGNLSDHYDPKAKILRLSDSVFSSTSAASLGVAAHECGHALQHAEGYAPLKIRNSVYPAVSFSSMASIPLIIIGFLLSNSVFIYAGIILFTAVVAFQLITLPVEFNASKRALAILRDSNILEESELSGAKKVLTAAALTYVASALVSLMQLLRFVLIASNRRD